LFVVYGLLLKVAEPLSAKICGFNLRKSARKENTLTLDKMRLGEEETWRAEKGSQKLFVVYGLLLKKEVYRKNLFRPFFCQSKI
jgi:hypothetical protein